MRIHKRYLVDSADLLEIESAIPEVPLKETIEEMIRDNVYRIHKHPEEDPPVLKVDFNYDSLREESLLDIVVEYSGCEDCSRSIDRLDLDHLIGEVLERLRTSGKKYLLETHYAQIPYWKPMMQATDDPEKIMAIAKRMIENSSPAGYMDFPEGVAVTEVSSGKQFHLVLIPDNLAIFKTIGDMFEWFETPEQVFNTEELDKWLTESED